MDKRFSWKERSPYITYVPIPPRTCHSSDHTCIYPRFPVRISRSMLFRYCCFCLHIKEWESTTKKSLMQLTESDRNIQHRGGSRLLRRPAQEACFWKTDQSKSICTSFSVTLWESGSQTVRIRPLDCNNQTVRLLESGCQTAGIRRSDSRNQTVGIRLSNHRNQAVRLWESGCQTQGIRLSDSGNQAVRHQKSNRQTSRIRPSDSRNQEIRLGEWLMVQLKRSPQ